MNMKKWRREIHSCANGLCQICGEEGTDAHHIHCVGYYPKEENKLSNGILLCKKCHVLAHRGKFGARAKGKYTYEYAFEKLSARASSAAVLPLIDILLKGDLDNERTAACP